ncbi:hypothetical protein PENSPDRAFT_749396 [Peniophora sp. CONT]|nr:hypothetical protein PENSPDRAFT_749396 [Peniophora sp. CONT]
MARRKLPAYTRAPKDGRCLIDTLPNEILAAIFLLVRNVCVEDDAKYGVPGWAVSLTYTCSRWRALALNTQLLWTMVPRHISLAWQQTFVKRSGGAPLELSLHFSQAPEDPFPDFQRTAMACVMMRRNLSRTRTLWLLFDSLEVYPKWSDFLCIPAPELQTLKMDSADAQAIELPSNVFQGHAPKLTSINFDNIYFTWPSLAFPELILLKINHSAGLDPDREGGMGTFAELLSLLIALPKLRYLELHDLPHSASSSNTLPLETASLPQMEFLKLFGVTEAVLLLVQHLILPSTANVLLKVSPSVDRPGDSIPSLCRHLKSHSRTPVTMQMKLSLDELCFELGMEHETYLRGYGSLYPSLAVEHERPETLSFPLFLIMISRLVIEGFTVTHLTSLHIESEALSTHTTNFWPLLLRHARAVERLGLKGPALPELCIALSRFLEGGNVVDGKQEPYLPSLQHLSLWDFSFEPLVKAAMKDLETVYWELDGPVAQDPDTLSDPDEQQENVLEWIWDDPRFKWISALKKRADEWKPLKEIELEECSGLPDWQWESYLFGDAAISVSSE